MNADNLNTSPQRPAGARMLFDGPIGPQGCVNGAAIVTAHHCATLNVEVTLRGVDVTFGDGTDEGEGDFFVTLQGDAAQLMMEACAAYLERLDHQAAHFA